MDKEPMDTEETIGRIDYALGALNEIRQHLTDLHGARILAEDAFQKLLPVWENLKQGSS